MDLSVNSRRQILQYLLTCDALRNDPPEKVCEHLSRLEHWGQLDAEEDVDENLVFAWAWWMLTDKALEAVKRGETPKRFNRGKNMVGFFAYFPQSIGAMQMRRLAKRAVRMERAHTFSIYTPRGKWFSVNTKYLRKPKATPREKRRDIFFRILEGAA